MADTTLDLTGEIEGVPPPKPQYSRFFDLPSKIPDPKEFINQQRQNVRPWLLFVQTSNFKVPLSLPRLTKRIMRNIEYFQANYLFVFLGLIVYCLITSPLILIAIAGSFYVGYRLNLRHVNKKFVLFGKELTLAQQYLMVWLCSMPVYYWVGAHAAMFWVIGASFTLITLHASFYNIEAVQTSPDNLSLLEEV